MFTIVTFLQGLLASIMCMTFTWIMSNLREYAKLELVIDDGRPWVQSGLDQLPVSIIQLVSTNEALAALYHYLCQQPVSMFLYAIGASIFWIISSHLSSQKARRARIVQRLTEQGPTHHVPTPPSSTRQANDSKIPNLPETSVRHGVTPNGVEADSPPSGIGKNVNDRTGRLFTPGYRTPFNPKRNFSGLAQAASVNYDTLQRNGVLNPDGMPTKKYSPDSRKGNGREISQVYDSPTRTWGNMKSSVNGAKSIERQAGGLEMRWVQDRDGGRVQQFSAAKEKWKAP
ncbi:hypothetical protein SLS59_002288 [Nothophoma quercina]|uniref:Uncharacterized protein n=1 Tax=Nothophoma quercina TaxID=749835 RepID=A0ABR3RSS5_9PLEO